MAPTAIFPASDGGLPWRRNVGLVLFSKTGNVLLAQRRHKPKAIEAPAPQAATMLWQFPQGGIDEGEVAHEAALRELKEEIGTDHAEIIGALPAPLFYEFPDYLGGTNVYRGKYRGQAQEWFALRFLGQDDEIDLSGMHDAEGPEFAAWRWGDLAEAPDLIIPFKRPVYLQVVAGFTPLAAALKAGRTLSRWLPPAVAGATPSILR